MTTRETIEATAANLGITMQSKFIPHSQSRSADDQPSLNWSVTILVNGRPALTTDYTAGSGHAPSYSQAMKYNQKKAVEWECENGRKARWSHNHSAISGTGPTLEPPLADVLYSLASDSDVLDCGGFEEWAENLGYDTDSRKAEETYRACLEIALKLRSALGEAGLQTLREAVQDY